MRATAWFSAAAKREYVRRLKATHTVADVWHDGDDGEEEEEGDQNWQTCVKAGLNSNMNTKSPERRLPEMFVLIDSFDRNFKTYIVYIRATATV